MFLHSQVTAGNIIDPDDNFERVEFFSINGLRVSIDIVVWLLSLMINLVLDKNWTGG